MSDYQRNLKISTLLKIDQLEDQSLVDFINDTITFYLKNKKVAFLSKYAEGLSGAYNVVPIREMVLEIIKLALRKTNVVDGVDSYKEAVAKYLENQGFGEDGQQTMNVKT